MKTIVMVALLAAAACNKSAPTSECEVSVGKGLDTFAATVKARTNNVEMQKQMTGVVGKLRTTLVQRCTEDKWAPEVLTCFQTVTNMRDMQACQGKLSAEQHTKVSTAIREVMMNSGRMPAGAAGHPGTLQGSDATGAAPAAGAPAAGAPAAGAPAAGAPAAGAPAAGSAAGSAGGSGGSAAAGGW